MKPRDDDRLRVERWWLGKLCQTVWYDSLGVHSWTDFRPPRDPCGYMGQ